MTDQGRALSVLIVNTIAFTICFAAWTMNGVLITFLVDRGVFTFNEAQVGWLIGLPVLTGSIIRLPLGILTDKYGGHKVHTLLLLAAAVPMYLMSYANTYSEFILGALGFGVSGGSFAVGIAYTSLWFNRERQGTALGVFGAGNAGAALTSIGAPMLLMMFTQGGVDLDAWRMLPRVYAAALAVTAVVHYMFSYERRADKSHASTLGERLAPLKHARVWRFGAYYVLVFGGYVGLSQWLIPYFVNVYGMSVAAAGVMAAIFSLPGGLIRAIGGWMSDHFGARRIMYWVLGGCAIGFGLLTMPRMDLESPGSGIMAASPGRVTAVDDTAVVVGERRYALRTRPEGWDQSKDSGVLVLPTTAFWHEPAVRVDDTVVKRQLLARGVTHVYFQANVWIFAALVFFVGFLMAIGKAAVYRHIPDYFPKDVGVVGGIVGVLGGLGGFFFPILFGYLLLWTGLWTTCWMILAVFALGCLVWMHVVIQRMLRQEQPVLMRQMETGPLVTSADPAGVMR